ncbi:GNAT family N-acetyltransferase [Pseudoalteromonas umbrosa]|uniref:GNAT family N-acetyltransferase n=1 Tax=Pseudoalteromonas umbrosa TaxID=3048489 RepID=UPI0024C3DABE|nr:GNAT family N-acetyltransferase [Pseudoalteromonas sp. B95]MDK1285809.1 GNAT family N-acetyltransferase [Pseudoalteromonas sp. B95]
MAIIRVAMQSDLTGIIKLFKELRPHDPDVSHDALMSGWKVIEHDENNHLMVAELDGEIASTCQLAIVPTLTNGVRPFAVIEHVITGALFRRRGLSEKVIEAAVELAWQQGCYKVMLLSGETRTAAHGVYEKVGFISGTERGFVIKNPHLDKN